MEFVRRLPQPPAEPSQPLTPYRFEPYNEPTSMAGERKSTGSLESSEDSGGKYHNIMSALSKWQFSRYVFHHFFIFVEL